MASKRMRKNNYKHKSVKRRLVIIQHITFCLKIMTSIAIVAVMSIVFIFGHDFLTQCDYFTADSVEIKGLNRLSPNHVVEQARISPKDNILSINLSLARKSLLAHPWIAEANVRREFPDKIMITIKEQSPIAVIDLGRKFLINRDGEIFKESNPSDPGNLPVVSGLELLDLNVSGEPRGNAFDAVMKVLKLGQRPECIIPNHSIKIIHADKEMGLTLYAFDPIFAIKLGYNDYPEKYGHLKNILFFLNKKSTLSDIKWIDLNNLNRIVINPVKMDSPA